jgi:2-polyprenyl-3-methyl-5-hydroxy-6-metoxy-1,4-benzoquinol methylase
MQCIICDAQRFRFLFEKNNYRIEKCLACELVQVTNVPQIEQLELGYDENFYEKYYKDLQNDHKKQRYEYLNFYNKIDQIEKKMGKKGNILDVGCSFGFFLDAARQRGWAVTGVELSQYAATYATQRFGLSVVNKSVLDAGFAENSFDVITMWYVIEHLPNPKQVLMHLSTLLNEDGMLVVSTPNVESYRAKIQGQKWRIWIPPEHLLYFSPDTIKKLCRCCCLQVIGYETTLPYEKYFRRTKLYKLLNRLKLSDNIIYYIKKQA